MLGPIIFITKLNRWTQQEIREHDINMIVVK